MILASFNVESLFERPVAMDLSKWTAGAGILAAHSKFNTLIQEPVYSPDTKRRLLGQLEELGLLKKNSSGALRQVSNAPFAILLKNKGTFLKQPRDSKKSAEIAAAGRGSWIGWAELRKRPVNEIAVRNTAQVICDIDPDVIGIIEAESRKTLNEFNKEIVTEVGGKAYDHVMLVEGNDSRGIDVGVMTRAVKEITAIQSHVDDKNPAGGLIFSRDCPVYEIILASGRPLWLLINHLKSQGYRGARDPDDIRREQAQRVREIYERLRGGGEDRVAVIGDLNASPAHDSLAPLLKNGSDLQDVSEHPLYQDDGIPGTHGAGYADSKFDYILLSPALFASVKAAGVFRRGVWDGRKKPRWKMYDNMKGQENGASDHALIWADLDLG